MDDFKENLIFSFFWNSINLLNLLINTTLMQTVELPLNESGFFISFCQRCHRKVELSARGGWCYGIYICLVLIVNVSC